MKLKEYLDTNGIKYVVFAKIIGISIGCLSNIVHGKVVPRYKTMKKIEKATNGNVSCKELLPE